MLAATGKNPEVVRAEKPGPAAWDLAAVGWPLRIDALVVDRAHDLTIEQVTDLAELGAGAAATVWLVWSDSSSWTAAAQKLAAEGHQVIPVGWNTAARELPVFPRCVPTSPPRDDGPALPGSDFPTFLADCRRLLSQGTFDQVAAQFQAAAERVEDWLDTHTDSDSTARPTDRITWSAGYATNTSARSPRRQPRCPARDPGRAVPTRLATELEPGHPRSRPGQSPTRHPHHPARQSPGRDVPYRSRRRHRASAAPQRPADRVQLLALRRRRR